MRACLGRAKVSESAQNRSSWGFHTGTSADGKDPTKSNLTAAPWPHAAYLVPWLQSEFGGLSDLRHSRLSLTVRFRRPGDSLTGFRGQAALAVEDKAAQIRVHGLLSLCRIGVLSSSRILRAAE